MRGGRPVSRRGIVALNTAIHDRVVEYLAPEDGPVLDVGAGDGTLAARLAADGFEVAAVDRTVDDFAPSGIPVVSADLNEGVPVADGRFSTVIATEVIEHLENPWQFVRELHRVAAPGGVAVISTPNLANIFTRAWFLLTGRLYNFLETSYRDIGHITPVYLWNLERMVEDAFDLGGHRQREPHAEDAPPAPHPLPPARPVHRREVAPAARADRGAGPDVGQLPHRARRSPCAALRTEAPGPASYVTL